MPGLVFGLSCDRLANLALLIPFPGFGRREGGPLIMLVLAPPRILGEGFAGQHEEFVRLRIEDSRFDGGGFLRPRGGWGGSFLANFALRLRRIEFGIRQRTAPAAIAPAAPRTPAAATVAIASPIRSTIAAPVGTPVARP